MGLSHEFFATDADMPRRGQGGLFGHQWVVYRGAELRFGGVRRRGSLAGDRGAQRWLTLPLVIERFFTALVKLIAI